ncbi:hypothetical protein L4C42_05280 [Vibrio wakamikoensis]|uniref:hypothetical protein n=1 Tax=Vibrio wakamikoensis TaxID=2910251 RepID=UPI003D1B401C
MRILYFMARRTLYSYSYLTEIGATTIGLTQPQLFKTIPFDVKAVNALTTAAQEHGYLLYPIDNQDIYRDLINSLVFPDDTLAPDIDWVGRMRLDDADPVRRLLAHSHQLNVDSWFVYGDVDLSHHATFAERQFLSKHCNNINQDLADKISSYTVTR